MAMGEFTFAYRNLSTVINNFNNLQRNELRQVMRKMNQNPTDEELDAMFKAADTDNNGYIGFKEFKMIAQANPIGLSLRQVRIFKMGQSSKSNRDTLHRSSMTWMPTTMDTCPARSCARPLKSWDTPSMTSS